MRTVSQLLAVAVVFLGPSTGLAQTAQADVTEAVAKIYAALNSANANGVIERMATGGYTEITADGRRVAIDDTYIRRILVGDFRANFEVTDLAVRVFGEVALVTGYRVGGILKQGAEPSTARFALSMVWIRERSAWKLLHVHLSPATAGRPDP